MKFACVTENSAQADLGREPAKIFEKRRNGGTESAEESGQEEFDTHSAISVFASDVSVITRADGGPKVFNEAQRVSVGQA